MSRAAPLAAALVWLALAACSRSGPSDAPAGGPLLVFVSIPPQAYFVERVGGPYVQVDVMVAPGQSAHTYEGTPAQLTRLSQARAYFSIGLEFEERLLGKLREQLPQLRVVDTRRGIALRRMDDGQDQADRPADSPDEHADGDAHGHAEHTAEPPHTHEGDDPHIWLNPRLVKTQARTICDTLSELMPAHRNEFERRLAEFHVDLEALDARMAHALRPLRGRPFVVFHPTYGYLADAYGLKQIAIEVSGREPSPSELARLVERIRATGAKVLLQEREYSSRSADALARELDVTVEIVDPLSRDYLNNLWSLTESIVRAAGPASP